MTHHTMARRGRPPGLTEARIDNRYIIAAAIIAGIKIATIREAPRPVVLVCEQGSETRPANRAAATNSPHTARVFM
jgi:hypothetical protein